MKDEAEVIAVNFEERAELGIVAITGVVAEALRHDDDVDDICRGLVADLGEAGILRNCVPAASGGVSERLDVRSLALCRESLAYHSGLADFSFAMQGLGSGAISLFGTDGQCENYLPDVAAGKKIAAFALSEADAGSDVAAMETTPIRYL